MPIKDRKDKFLRSKSIINKRKQLYKRDNARYPNINKYYYRDKLKIKLLCDKIFEQLITNKTIVRVHSSGDNISYCYILCHNTNYIICELAEMFNELNTITIVNKKNIESIDKYYTCIGLYVKNEFNIQQQYNFFYNNVSFLDVKFNNDIKTNIISYLNIINCDNHRDYNISNPIELFTYLQQKDLFLELYITNYSPVLYGKIIKF